MCVCLWYRIVALILFRLFPFHSRLYLVQRIVLFCGYTLF
jgi:hypothetical protein